MHPLRQYLKDIDEPVQDFARRVGVSRQSIYRILAGRQAPKPGLAQRIVEATGGAVCFEALYCQGGAPFGATGAPSAMAYDDFLEHARLRVALFVAARYLAPSRQSTPPEEVFDIAAEAVANTYAALSSITTRCGQDRLRQALRPVLEEILREYSDAPCAAALDRGAAMATQLYFHDYDCDPPDRAAP
jgi:DNA-binding XRE family transcriptional regulator